jgi:hypothetical protein
LERKQEEEKQKISRNQKGRSSTILTGLLENEPPPTTGKAELKQKLGA